MSHPEPATLRLAPPPYEPRRPALIATAAFTLWPLLLSLPMFAGMWLASPWSDQYSAGFSFHAWSAEWFKRTGRYHGSPTCHSMSLSKLNSSPK